MGRGAAPRATAQRSCSLLPTTHRPTQTQRWHRHSAPRAPSLALPSVPPFSRRASAFAVLLLPLLVVVVVVSEALSLSQALRGAARRSSSVSAHCNHGQGCEEEEVEEEDEGKRWGYG